MRKKRLIYDHGQTKPEGRALGDEIAASAYAGQQDDDSDYLKPAHALGLFGTM